MNKLLTQIQQPQNCGPDLTAENPLVVEAVAGFSAYPVLFNASCLQDDAGDYCFADAITNASKAADTFPYYLPLGTELPLGIAIDCNSCVQRTMDIYANATTDGSNLGKTYDAAAKQLDDRCGAAWVPVKSVASSAASFKGISMSHFGFAILTGLVTALVMM